MKGIRNTGSQCMWVLSKMQPQQIWAVETERWCAWVLRVGVGNVHLCTSDERYSAFADSDYDKVCQEEANEIGRNTAQVRGVSWNTTNQNP